MNDLISVVKGLEVQSQKPYLCAGSDFDLQPQNGADSHSAPDASSSANLAIGSDVAQAIVTWSSQVYHANAAQATQLVRVRLAGLPSPDHPKFQRLNEAFIASAVHGTFNVPTEARSCAIYRGTDERSHRSGHIDVTTEARDEIAAKLADGVKLELTVGKKKDPEV